MMHAMIDKLPRELRDLKLENSNPHQTPVLICYNLTPTEISLDKLFNLFSLYGTVTRIKIMREKTDSALIQYSDAFYATLAYTCLQGAPMFGQEIQIRFSKNTEVKLPPPSSNESHEDVKRTRAFQLKDQRYGGDDVEKYVKGACRPTTTVFIANIHEDVSQEEIIELFSTYGNVLKFQFRPPKERAKKKMAVLEMDSEATALTALCNLHNSLLHDSHIKVAFSRTSLH